MRLYQRFEIPDDWDWSTGRPAPAMDVALEREVFVYRGHADALSLPAKRSSAESIREEFGKAGGAGSAGVDIFDAPDSLWLVTPRDATADPLVQRFRQAGLIDASKAVIEPPPLPCPNCKRPLDNNGPLCSSCHRIADSARDGHVAEGQKADPPFNLWKIFFPLLIVALMVWMVYYVWPKPHTSSQTNPPYQEVKPDVPVAVPPAVADFYVGDHKRSVTIFEGDPAELHWRTSNATSVEIDPDPYKGQHILAYKTQDTLTVHPASRTVYKLVAVADTGKSSPMDVTVDVRPRPVISASFYIGDPRYPQKSANIFAGQSIELNWETRNAFWVQIEANPSQEFGSLNLAGSRTVSPAQTTTYTFTASPLPGDRSGLVKSSITVYVTPRLSLSVTANGYEREATVPRGNVVHICWAAPHAEQVLMQLQDKSYEETGKLPACIDQYPQQDTTYSFTATLGTQRETAEVRVHVTQPSRPLFAQRPSNPNPSPNAPARASGDIFWAGTVGPDGVVNFVFSWGSVRGGGYSIKFLSMPQGSFQGSTSELADAIQRDKTNAGVVLIAPDLNPSSLVPLTTRSRPSLSGAYGRLPADYAYRLIHLSPGFQRVRLHWEVR